MAMPPEENACELSLHIHMCKAGHKMRMSTLKRYRS